MPNHVDRTKITHKKGRSSSTSANSLSERGCQNEPSQSLDDCGYANCQYLDPEGKAYQCRELANDSGFCFWHDKHARKDVDGIKEQLESYAKKGGLLRGIFVKHADLCDVNLVNYNENGRYDLSYANFYRSNMSHAHLFNAKFDNANLMKADLHEANIHCASFIHCNLLGVKLVNTKIDNIRIGATLQQENEAKVAEQNREIEKARDLYEQSEEIYRDLRKASEAQGTFSMAGYFLQKELTMRRFQMPKYSMPRAISKTVDVFCGYGESPIRVIFFSLILIILCALAYFFTGISFDGQYVGYQMEHAVTDNIWAFLDCLYYSIVTFTTLGYGDFIPIGVSRLVAATEAFTGSFTIALFVVVFVKKMTR